MPDMIYGQVEAVSAEVERITEAEDIRITETGDIRITNQILNNTIEGSLVAEGTKIEGAFKIYVKVAGIWKQADPSVKYNGNWVVPESIYANISGVWKRVY